MDRKIYISIGSIRRAGQYHVMGRVHISTRRGSQHEGESIEESPGDYRRVRSRRANDADRYQATRRISFTPSECGRCEPGRC